MSEFGAWHKGYGPVTDNLDYLTDSYIRRKRWEWEGQAVAVVNALGKAMQPAEKKASMSALQEMGFAVHGDIR